MTSCASDQVFDKYLIRIVLVSFSNYATCLVQIKYKYIFENYIALYNSLLLHICLPAQYAARDFLGMVVK
jgi:hypothetical protein